MNTICVFFTSAKCKTGCPLKTKSPATVKNCRDCGIHTCDNCKRHKKGWCKYAHYQTAGRHGSER